jgi:hypothetical protein
VNHFHEGQHVRLQIPEIGGVTGEVAVVRDDCLLISLFLEVQAMPSVMEHPGVVLEYTAVRGLYRRTGTARFDLGGVDSVRFIPAGEAELIQRRDYARVKVCVPVLVTIGDFGPAVSVDSIDLSGSGVLLGGEALEQVELAQGSAVGLSIAIGDDEPPVEASGTVLRELEDGSRGVHFDYIDDQHRERLVHFLFERQRLMRQAGRD